MLTVSRQLIHRFAEINSLTMETAFITGASEGMGYEFARQFANKGINLILAARNEIRLKSISAEFSRLGVNVLYYARDLSIPDNARFIFEDLKAKNISVQYLVNNAGFGINGNYTDIEWDRELEMFNLNMLTLAYFTKVFASEMKAKGFGRILNIGSTGSFQPGPFMAGYCASKAFVLSLSEAVNYELRETDVKVSTLCPGVTDTKFHAQAQTGNTVMSKFLAHAKPGEVAEYGIKLMLKGKSMGIHGLSNKMIVSSNRFACRNMSTAIAGKMLKSEKEILEG
jgi:short-subunit dehydrogenase